MVNIKTKAVVGAIPLLIILIVAIGVEDTIVRQLMASLGVIYGAYLFRYLTKYQEKSKAMPTKNKIVG